MSQIRCVVERITYQNPENGYSVLKVSVKGQQELVSLVGSFPDVSVGAVLSVDGEWKTDKKYGVQFAARKWEETLPSTVYGIEKYLGSGLIKGVGPAFARRITRKFGADTLRILDECPERLLEVEGIGKKRVETVRESWLKQKEIKNIMIFLQGYDVSAAYAAKIFKTYGNESIAKVKENPYRLADDIWGIGFKTADTIAAKLGFSKDSYLRCRSGIFYTLSALSDEGHVYATEEQLLEKGTELLESSRESVSAALFSMLQDGDLIREEDAVYLPPLCYAEKGTASKLLLLMKAPASASARRESDLERILGSTGITYEETQRSAILEAVRSKVMVLTGGPGTGKTTTTLGMIRVLKSLGMKVLLAAPTGRAAKRMTEATGMEAKTLHRLLEVKPPEGYQRNEEHPLEGDVLIVDESSMIDIILMNALLKAVPPAMKLILVGDVDQLPSVGPGNVLRDIIASGTVPVVHLTKIFRQAQSSKIIVNAHRINAGEYPYLNNTKNSDFFYIEQEDPEKAANEIVDLVKKRLPGYCGIPSSEIQVLTPMQKGVLGAANLNLLLQQAINPEECCLYRAGKCFRLHDKVMQIRNNYDLDVFNGDIGRIVRLVPEERELSVEFDGRTVDYEAADLDELVPAYAVTVHKSQGSEYPAVVMPVMMSHYVMLQRNLLYTGITRAKKMLVLVGTKKAMGFALRNVTVTKRNSRLKERLREGAGNGI